MSIPLQAGPTARILAEVELQAYRPPPKLTVHEWAEANRVVASAESAEPGPWKSRPYQIEPLECVTDPRYSGVVYIACSQGGGKTEFLLNCAGFFMDADPAPVIAVTADLNLAKAFSQERLASMIRETESLSEKVADSRSRDSGNSTYSKLYPGGGIAIVGANSPAGLSSRPRRVALFDEIDRFPPSAGAEGDPIKLATTRTVSFWNRVHCYATSPGLKGASRSERLWQDTDQREWMIPCPDCSFEQYTRWPQVQWDKDDNGDPQIETAEYVCERCGSCWSDVARWRAIRQGRWVAKNPGAPMAGFRLPAMSCLGRRLSELVKEWLEAQGNPEELKVFVNTKLCEWWEQRGQSPSEEKLYARREEYPSLLVSKATASEPERRVLMVPREVAVLTAAVDVQLNRIELGVEGWGFGQENWKLEYHVLYGDPTARPVWSALWALMKRPRPLERGGEGFILSTCVDSNYAAQSVSEFTRGRQRYRRPDRSVGYLWAIRGDSGPGLVWPREPGKGKYKVPIWTVKVDTAKDSITARAEDVLAPGPGYIHFPITDVAGISFGNVGKGFDAEYFHQHSAEHALLDQDRKGFARRTWQVKSGRERNEAFDVAVYNYAALCALLSMGFDLDKEALKLRESVAVSESTSAPEFSGADIADDKVEQEAAPVQHKRRKKKRRMGASSYLQ